LLLLSLAPSRQLDTLPASKVDLSDFESVRAVPNAPSGLAALSLDLRLLAGRHSFDDVRIVDASERQLPYVVDHRERRTNVLTFKQRPTSERSTLYEIDLPDGGIPAGTLRLETRDQLFEREVTIRMRQSGGEVADVSRGWWISRDARTPAPPLELSLVPATGRTLLIEMSNGDNPPLSVTRVTFSFESPALRFFHPGGEGVKLAAGNRTTSAPRYDLATRETEIVLRNVGRVRDVARLPSGKLVIAVDAGSPHPSDRGRIIELSPR
jgi:hypothetical protein